MSFFQIVRNNYEILGISPDQSRFHGRFLINFIFYWSMNIWVAVTLLSRAQNLNESVEYIYIITSTIVYTISLTILRLKQTKLFELIDICDGIVLKSKRNILRFDWVLRWKKYQFTIKFFRTRWFSTKPDSNERILRWNQQTNRKMDWNR